MTDKQIIIDGVDISGCPYYIDSEGGCSSHDCECIKCIHNVCFYKDYKAKEQECEALQMSENEAREIIAELQAYKDINEDFKTAWEELKTENEELIRRITKIFACLIKANRTNKIVDTLWVDNITTLWDYIALTLGIEGDQVQIEKQILQKISEVENDNRN